MRVFESKETLLSFVGKSAKAPPFFVGQGLVDAFAVLTGDEQWIHTDVERSLRESIYGGTVAHALLVLSLLPKLYAQTFEFRQRSYGVNYGFDKVRVPKALRCGQNIHAEFQLFEVEIQNSGMRCTWDVTVNDESTERPVVVARWITLNVYSA